MYQTPAGTVEVRPLLGAATAPRRGVAGFGLGLACIAFGTLCLVLAIAGEVLAWRDAQRAVTENALRWPMPPNQVAPTAGPRAPNALLEKVAAQALTVGMLTAGLGVPPSQALEAAVSLDADPAFQPPEVAAPAPTSEPEAAAPAVLAAPSTTLETAAPKAPKAPAPKQRMSFEDYIRSKLPQPDPNARPPDPEKTKPADPFVFYITLPFVIVALYAIFGEAISLFREKGEAERKWRAAPKSSLYYRIGGDSLIQPASWVFEDFILANRTARKIFDGQSAEESRKLRNTFMNAILDGPCDPAPFKALMRQKFCDDPEYDALVSCMTRAFQDLEVPQDLVLEIVSRADVLRDDLLDRPP
eukprot:EG_transcript_17466